MIKSEGMLNKNSKIYLAGHQGFVGSAITRALSENGYKNIIVRTRRELDLREKNPVSQLFLKERPNIVILAAAKVGGIGANTKYPVEFLIENLEIQNNVISEAAKHQVDKLIFLGSSCIYPREAVYPITPDQLLTGPFEPTNEAYGLAKVAGIKLCQAYFNEYGKNFISIMPTNVYGPNERYDPENSHVIPSMILKVLRAMKAGEKSVTLWGSGNPLREFLHVDDLAHGIIMCMEKWDLPEIVNIGSQIETSIAELAVLVCKACGFSGKILWDKSRPDGIPRKVMDSSAIRNLGWRPKISLEAGLRQMVEEARSQI